MRKIATYGALFITALLLQLTSIAQKEKSDKKTIQGSGNIITKEIPVQSFDQLSASGVFSLLLSQGDKESLKIEADDNFQELFEVKNEGSKLVISMKKNANININGKNKMKVHITFRKLKDLDLSMVGGTSSEEKLSFDELKLTNQSVGSVNLEMSLQKLHLENSSVGTVRLSGTANNAVIKSSGVGSLNAGDFVVQTMEIDNSGVGSAEVNAAKELKVSDSFLGKVRNRGSATVKRNNKVVI